MPSPLLPVVNTVLAPTLRGSRGPRRPGAAFERMLTAAARAARVDPPDPEQPELADVRYLVEQFAGAAELSAIGWTSVTVDVQNRLANRMRVQRLHADHPELAAEDVDDPIVVVGLPRTATTLVHHLIAAAEGHRGPALWEWLHTDLPLPEAERRRIVGGVERGQQVVRWLLPEMLAIHPQQALKPDEDAFLLMHGPQHQARALMPEYERWENAREASSDYAYLKQALQVLQHGRPRRRFVLKNPIHLAHLDLLLERFPRATVVWMHRNPVTVMGSICSLVEASHRLHLRRTDPEAIGRMCLRMLSRLVARGRAAQGAIPPGQVLHVPYDWLTADPHATVPELYGLLGVPWTERDETGLDAIVRRPSRRPHEYALHRYGLEETDLDEAFGDYGNLAAAPRPTRR